MPSSTPNASGASVTLVTALLASGWWLGRATRANSPVPTSSDAQQILPVALAHDTTSPTRRGASMLAIAVAMLAVLAAAGGWWLERTERLGQDAAAATGGDPDR